MTKETRGIGKKRRKTALLLLAGMFSVCSAAYAVPEGAVRVGWAETSLSLPAYYTGTGLFLQDTLSLFPVQPTDSSTIQIKEESYTEVATDTLQTSLERDSLVEVVAADTLQAIAESDTLQEFSALDTLSVSDLPEGWRSQLPEGNLYGIPVTDTIRVAFRQGRSTLEEGFEANRMALARLRSLGSLPLMQKIHIVGSASPEGSVAWNRQLSKRRAEVLSDFLKREAGLPDSLVEYVYIGRDWPRLLRLAEADTLMPYQEEETAFLQEVVDSTAEGEDPAADNLGRLSRMEEGVPYQYMYANLFPELRRQQCVVRYEIPYVYRCDTVYIPTPVCVYDTLCVHDTLYIE
ncbi:MAG: hypothetical protein LUC18_00205, partial [Porphyromonadaceae bacterium]|nr:hypothetical protein [Porphyromonadaceae bacterium]